MQIATRKSFFGLFGNPLSSLQSPHRLRGWANKNRCSRTGLTKPKNPRSTFGAFGVAVLQHFFNRGSTVGAFVDTVFEKGSHAVLPSGPTNLLSG